MCNMSRPPSGRDEYVILIDFQRRRSVEGICHLDTLKQPLESLESLELLLPKCRQVLAVIHYDDSYVDAGFGESSREVKFGDVATKNVLEINGGDQEVNPSWCSSRHVQ